MFALKSCVYTVEMCVFFFLVLGDRVEVALPGHTLIRWEFSPEVWQLLWDLRTSLQAMIHRNLRPSECGSRSDSRKDSELIGLLVDLLNNTDEASSDQDDFNNSLNSTDDVEADRL